jgi:uncharacterized membrane protein HdeD (DUF308 family)
MTTDAVPSQAQQVTPWWLLLLQGLAALLLGILMLTAPGATTLVLIGFLGWYWLIGGVLGIVGIFVDSRQWAWKLLAGVLGILAGVAVLNHPGWSAFLVETWLVWLMGVLGLAIGASMLVRAFQGGGLGAGILGAVSIVLALLLILRPFVAVVTVPLVFAMFAIVGGIACIIVAFTTR